MVLSFTRSDRFLEKRAFCVGASTILLPWVLPRHVRFLGVPGVAPGRSKACIEARISIENNVFTKLQGSIQKLHF